MTNILNVIIKEMDIGIIITKGILESKASASYTFYEIQSISIILDAVLK